MGEQLPGVVRDWISASAAGDVDALHAVRSPAHVALDPRVTYE
jgi:ketosteroid isomerase-like protein